MRDLRNRFRLNSVSSERAVKSLVPDSAIGEEDNSFQLLGVKEIAVGPKAPVLAIRIRIEVRIITAERRVMR